MKKIERPLAGFGYFFHSYSPDSDDTSGKDRPDRGVSDRAESVRPIFFA
jgi:hypothetical protein